MKFTEHVSLAPYNTFKIGGEARVFVEVTTAKELSEAISYAREQNLEVLILGGGSNILISDAGFDGLVIRIQIKGIHIDEVTDDEVMVTSGAGENWDDLVSLCVSRGLYGLENLSAIPGTVGAAPVQNIGAYGVEIKDTLHSVQAFNTEIGQMVTFSNSECLFAYRDSIFKRSEGKKYVVTSVTFKLTKKGTLALSYKDIDVYFKAHLDIVPTLSVVRTAVIAIRAAKLPNLAEYGTAGSFFKNPIVPREQFQHLQKKYPLVPSYVVSDELVKIPLGWILDNVCNFKGLRRGSVGVYKNQALVLVNFGGGTATEIKALAQEIIDKVRELTGIVVEPEVQFV